jgi:cation transport regulator ChaC
MYELTAQDVQYLNTYEGSHYERQTIPVKLINKEDLHHKHAVESLVYVDVERKSESQPMKEYIHRMNMAIADALQEGIPSDYLDKYLRAFIPHPDNEPLLFDNK